MKVAQHEIPVKMKPCIQNHSFQGDLLIIRYTYLPVRAVSALRRPALRQSASSPRAARRSSVRLCFAATPRDGAISEANRNNGNRACRYVSQDVRAHARTH
eukprot:1221538-Pleurochrysis_carterae.AAC.2